jgi:hypothetical protein
MKEQQYDIFISHAFEDKASFSDKLAEELKKNNLSIWYSGHELKLGDSIADSITKALNSSRYGIVVISPSYIEKHWAMSELNALLAQAASRSRILPVLHGLSIDEARHHLPLLADRYAVSSGKGMQVVVEKVVQAVKETRATSSKTKDSPTSSATAGTRSNQGTGEQAKKSTGSGAIWVIILIAALLLGIISFYNADDDSSSQTAPSRVPGASTMD